MILLRRDPKTGKYRCPECDTTMTVITREGRHPRTQAECPDQRCGKIEPLYDVEDER